MADSGTDLAFPKQKDGTEVCDAGIRARLAGYEKLRAQRAGAPNRSAANGCQLRQVPTPARVTAMQPLRALSITPLADICKQAAGDQVSVEATVRAAGQLELKELQLQPGEFVPTRSFLLEQDDSTCQWVLWASDAERYGPELLSQKVIVHDARVYKSNGQHQLTGLARIEVCG